MSTLDGTRQYIRRNVFKKARSQDSIPAPFLNGDGFVDFGPHDPSNPRNWSTARKWYITLCTSFLAMFGNIASSIPSGCLTSISKELHVSEEAAGLSLTLYLLGYSAGPFLFAPISEFYGRRIIFRTTFPVYLAFSVLCAFAPNFGALLVGRFLAGTFVSAVLSNTPGVLADVWDHMERGNALAIFSSSVWAGPSLGPIISGFLVLHKDWRWGFYVVACVSGLAALFMLTIPETNGSIILIERARRVRKARVSGYEGIQTEYEAAGFTLLDIYRTALTRPWALMLDTISLLCSIYMAVIFTLQYMLFTIYPIVFQDMRGWNEGVGQLPLLGTVVGAVPGALIIFYDTKRRRDKLKAGFDLEPEDRLTIRVVGSQGRRGILPSAPGRPAATPAGTAAAKSTVIPVKDSDGKFPCPHCTKTYLHAKHLKRHLLRHTGDRPYMCVLCRDTFSRSDILKRHFQKCSIRRGNPTGASHLSHPQAHVKKNAQAQKAAGLANEGDMNHLDGLNNMPRADGMVHPFGMVPVQDDMNNMASNQNQVSRSSSGNRLENRAPQDRSNMPGVDNSQPYGAAPTR